MTTTTKTGTKGTYTQCLFISFDHDGSEPTAQKVQLELGSPDVVPFYEYVAWIPTRFATLKRVLVFTTVHGHWLVQDIWGTRDAKWVELKSHDHTRQRKASDI